jgi:type IV pilus biogenesis protein CpaD/CtpE
MNPIQMQRVFLSLVVAAATTGCSGYYPQRVAADFGASNRVVVRNQVADPEAALNAGGSAVVGLDGQKGGRVIRAYRGDNSTRDFGDATVNTNSVTSDDN